jgi:hypothetical protein
MNVVLVGEEGRAALSSIAPGATVHAVGWYPAPGETSRAITCHTRGEHELAEIIAADQVIGGDPKVWGMSIATRSDVVTEQDFAALDKAPDHSAPPKRRGRPPKVK